MAVDNSSQADPDPDPPRTHDERARHQKQQRRRAFLQRVGQAAVTTASITSNTGCLDLLVGGGGGPGGTRPQGNIPHYQSVTREDADTVATSSGQLTSAISDDNVNVVWIPRDQRIDMSGSNYEVENTVIASDRSGESTGAIITTSDRGMSSPTMDNALFTLGEGARLSGVVIRGPLYNWTASDVIPGYIPLAPGSTYDIRQDWRDQWVCRAVAITADDAQVDNCEIWGFSAAIMVGNRSTPVNPTIMYCYIHNCMMTSYGYCVDVKRGIPTVYRCTFDAFRHAINGFGYADAGYYVIECDFGPHVSGHIVDMHGIHNNISGSSSTSALDYRYRAGGTMLVRRCRFLTNTGVGPQHHSGTDAGTYEPDPYITTNRESTVAHASIRAVPADGFYFENNECVFDSPSEAINQSSIPARFSTNDRGWHNIFTTGNAWGALG